MYATQILVISELSPEDCLYLYCLAGELADLKLINSLTQDYTLNKENEIYIKYMHQFLGSHMKGERIMVCENLFKLYGTSSKEIAENATKKVQEYYVPQIDKLTSENTLLNSEILVSAPYTQYEFLCFSLNYFDLLYDINYKIVYKICFEFDLER